MKPLALITTDLNPDYLFLLPIVCKSWELQGFDVMPIVVSDTPSEEVAELMAKYIEGGVLVYKNRKVTDLNPALWSQCLRMYEAGVTEDRYVVLTDVDMFIASSFLYRDFDKVNVF